MKYFGNTKPYLMGLAFLFTLCLILTPSIDLRGASAWTVKPAEGPARQRASTIDYNVMAQPTALAGADLDGDGVLDLISGYATPTGGALVVHRGNRYWTSPANRVSPQSSNSNEPTGSPFLASPQAFELPESPDFIGTGDFDSDGHCDVVVAARGSNAIYLMKGDEKGRPGRPQHIELPGRVTTLAAGEINQAGGLMAVVAGIVGADGPELMVFKSFEGILRSRPETIALPAEATALALGHLDDACPMDLAVAAGRDLLIVHLRNRKFSIDRYSFPSPIISIVPGDFMRDRKHHEEIAVLSEDGMAHILSENKTGEITEAWRGNVLPAGSTAAEVRLICVRNSEGSADNLGILDSTVQRLYLFTSDLKTPRQGSDVMAFGLQPPVVFPLDLLGLPKSVVPIQLNADQPNCFAVLKADPIRLADAMTSVAQALTLTSANANGALNSTFVVLTPQPASTNTPMDLSQVSLTTIANGGGGGAFVGTCDPVPGGASASGCAPLIPNASTYCVTTTSGVNAGETIIVTVATDPSASVSVTDNANNLYLVEANISNPGGVVGVHTIVFAAHNVATLLAGSTITVAATPAVHMLVFTATRVTGLAALPLDQMSASIGFSTSATSGFTGTTTQAQELLFGAIGVKGSSSDSFTPGNGYTLQDHFGVNTDPPFPQVCVAQLQTTINTESQLVSVTGSYQADAMLGTSRAWAAALLTYKVAGGPPPTNQPPVASCKNVTVSAGANCTAAASIDNGSSDPDGDAITLSQSPPGPYSLGNTTVTLTVTDSHSASSQCTATVTVVDTTAPAVNCSAVPAQTANADANCSATVPDVSGAVRAQSSDNCTPSGSLAITQSPTQGSRVSGTGSHPITVAVCDAASPANCTSCVVSFTVIDNTPPTINCPSNMVISTEPGLCSAVATYSATATDNCSGSITPVCSPSSGTRFPKGTSTVNCSATDASSNTSRCSFTVTVNDTEKPVINCPANIVTHTDPDLCSAVVSFTVTASDNCALAGPPACAPPSGSIFPKGTTTVTCTVSDTSGNQSSCSFTVTVNDLQAPSINCPPNIIVAAAASCPIATSAPVNFTVTASDNCPGVTFVCKNQNGVVVTSGQPFPVGTTTVTCTATDTSGNTASCSFNVSVFSFCLQDETNPGNVVLVNAQTGDFSFCCGGVPIASGRGTLTTRGCIGSIDHTKGNRQVHIQWDTAAVNGLGAGTAFVQKLSDKFVCQITDKNMSNNTCQCANPPPVGSPRKPPKERTF